MKTFLGIFLYKGGKGEGETGAMGRLGLGSVSCQGQGNVVDVTWRRNETENHVSWYAHERAERQKPPNRVSPPWENAPEYTMYSPIFFERHDK